MIELRLEWTTDDGTANSFALDQGETLIGRREECDLILTFGFVSGHHARLVRRGDALEIEDLDSTNGTFVNGRQVKKADVRPGDRIELGRLALRVAGPSDRTEIAGEALEELTTMFPGTETGAGNLDKLAALLEFQLHWGERFSAPDLFRAILRHALDLSHAERAFVLVRSGDKFEFASGLDETGTPLGADSFRTSRSVERKVRETREPVFMTEGITGDLAQEQSIMDMDLRAVACLPLLQSDGRSGATEVAGILYLDSTRPMHRLSGLDQQILRSLAVEAARVLERVRMLRDREVREQMERELQLARQTQEELLPRRLPRSREWEVRAWCRPTRHVGGDLFDFVDLEPGRLVGMLADVSGKGVAASLLSSSVQGAMQAWVRSGRALRESVQDLNDYLCDRTTDDRFVTLFSFDFSAGGKGVYVNAGHLPAFLYRASADEVEWLDERGPVAGAIEHIPYSEHSVAMARGDLLLVYSDGVTEAFDASGEEFGEERLEAVFAQHAARGVDAVAEALDAALGSHLAGTEPSDDVTVVLVQRLSD